MNRYALALSLAAALATGSTLLMADDHSGPCNPNGQGEEIWSTILCQPPSFFSLTCVCDGMMEVYIAQYHCSNYSDEPCAPHEINTKVTFGATGDCSDIFGGILCSSHSGCMADGSSVVHYGGGQGC